MKLLLNLRIDQKSKILFRWVLSMVFLKFYFICLKKSVTTDFDLLKETKDTILLL